MRSSSILSLLLVLFLVFSCGNGGSPQAMLAKDEAMAGEAQENMPERTEGSVAQPVDRKIIRTGELRFEVSDLDQARGIILEQVTSTGGYVEGDDRSDWGNALAMTLRVRIPAEKFDRFIEELKGLGELQSQSINAQDVTAEWVDVEARLTAKKKVEVRYLELVAQARTVTEVLEVERELGNVRAEIESMEGRMKVLRDQVSMSTLTITCTKPQARLETFSPQLGVALREGWNNLLRFFVGLLYIWPFLLVLAVLIWWWARRKGKRGTTKG